MFSVLNYTSPQEKVVWTLHVTRLPLWILNRWIRIRSQNSLSLGEKVYNLAKWRFYFCTKKLISFRILSCWIHIWYKNVSTVPQNSPSLREKVYNLAKLEVSRRFYYHVFRWTRGILRYYRKILISDMNSATKNTERNQLFRAKIKHPWNLKFC